MISKNKKKIFLSSHFNMLGYFIVGVFIITFFFVFNNNVFAKDINIGQPGDSIKVLGDNFCIGGVCRSSWLWNLNGTSAYYNDGNVGIGANNPVAKLHVARSDGQMLATFRDSGQNVHLNIIPETGNILTLLSKFSLNLATNDVTTSRLFINTSGNIGIGTVAPSAKLEIKNSTHTTDFLALVLRNHDASVRQWEFTVGKSASGNYGNYPLIISQNAQTYLGDLVLQPGKNTIFVNGNVGIGTTSPPHRLSISGSTTNYSIDAGNKRIGNVSDPDDNKDVVTLGYLNSSLSAFAPGGASSTWAISGNNIYNTNTTGNVGIGTTLPSQMLDVTGNIVTNSGSVPSIMGPGTIVASSPNSAGSGFYAQIRDSAGSYGGFTMGYGTTLKWFYGMSKNITDTTALVFYEDGQAAKARMTIATGGNVGIGTTDPRAPLEIYKDGASGIGSFLLDQPTAPTGSTGKGPHFFFKSAGVNRGWFGFFDSAAHGNGTALNLRSARDVRFGASIASAPDMIIKVGGNVGIGTDTPPHRLSISGSTTNYSIDAGNKRIGNVSDPDDNKDVVTLGYLNSSLSAFAPGGASSTWAISGNNIYNTNTTGNVGIGTTTPSQKLDVFGSVVIGTDSSLLLTNNANIKANNGTDDILYLAGKGTGSIRVNYDQGSGGFEVYNGSTVKQFGITGLGVGYFAGNVGIGMTGPSEKLEVSGAGNTGIVIQSTGSATSYGPKLELKDVSAVRGFFRLSSLNNDVELGTVFGNSVKIYTQNTEKMRILSDGNVGIGTATPPHRLSISGSTTNYSIDAGNKRIGNVSDPDDNKDVVTLGYLNSSLSAFAPGGASSTWAISGNNIYNTNTTGNVGVGTTTPSHKLTVMGSGYFLGDTSVPNAPVDLGFYLGKSLSDENRRMEVVSPAGGVSYIDFTQPSVDYRGRIAYYLSDNSFRFSTNSVERLRLDATGNVGIGTTNPGSKLDVSGNINATSLTTASIKSDTTNGSPYTLLTFSGDAWPVNSKAFSFLTYNSTGSGVDREKLAIYSGDAGNIILNATGGNVGIGTATPPHKLSISGSTTNYSIDAGNKRIGNVSDPDDNKDVVTLGYLNSSLSAFAPGGASSTWAISGNNIYNTNTTGNVGIGTNSPSFKAEINGTFKASNNNSSITLDADGDILIGI